MPNAKKVETVKELSELIGRSQALILADYRGLTVEQLSGLRASMRKQNSSFRVVKNRLMKRALTERDTSLLDQQLVGPTGVAFGFDDPVALAKLLLEFEREHEKFQLKGGMLGHAALDAKGIVELSRMPGLRELRTQLAGALKNPLRKVPIVLNKPLQQTAYAGTNMLKKILYAFQNRAKQLEA